MDNAAYSKLLAPIVQEFRAKPYSFWHRQLDHTNRMSSLVITREAIATDGTMCQVESSRVGTPNHKPAIRVMFAVEDGGRDAFMPTCTDDFIIASEGTFIGE